MLFLCEIIDHVLEARWLNGSCRRKSPLSPKNENCCPCKISLGLLYLSTAYSFRLDTDICSTNRVLQHQYPQGITLQSDAVDQRVVGPCIKTPHYELLQASENLENPFKDPEGFRMD